MPILWKKTGFAKNNSDVVDVDTSALNIAKPTVVFFPGQITRDDTPDTISKDLNQVKKLFVGMETPPDVYLWSHPAQSETPDDKSLSASFKKALYKLTMNKLPALSASDLSAAARLLAYQTSCQTSSTPLAHEQAQKLIMPLVMDDGKPLPMEEARKNLRNLTFLAYCIGNLYVQELYNAAEEMMQKSGFDRDEAKSLLKEIVLVSFGSIAEPREETDRYTTVSLIHNDDSMLRRKDQWLHPLRSLFNKFDRRLKITELSSSSILITATVQTSQIDRNKRLQVIEGVRLSPWEKDAFNHLISDYVNSNDNTSQVSRIVQFTLINAVSRTHSVRPMILLGAPAIAGKGLETERYERKMAAAFNR